MTVRLTCGFAVIFCELEFLLVVFSLQFTIAIFGIVPLVMILARIFNVTFAPDVILLIVQM